MKKVLLFGLISLPLSMVAQTSELSDNFDSYTAGNTVAAESSGIWETWSGGTGTPEDAFVSATYASSGSNSMNVYNNGAGAYLHDMIMPFPSVYTTGEYEFKMKIYVPSGSAGYFNIGSVWTSGGGGYEYGIDVFFNADGSGFVSTPGTGMFTYTQDAWVDVSVVVNISGIQAETFIGGSSVSITPWGAASGMGVVDIFGFGYTDATGATEAGSNFYVDDVEVVNWTGVGIDENEVDVNMSVYPNPSNGDFLINLGDVDAGNYQLTVTDALGNAVYTEQLFVSGASTLNYDLNLASGIYFVNLSDGTKMTTKKLLVEK